MLGPRVKLQRSKNDCFLGGLHEYSQSIPWRVTEEQEQVSAYLRQLHHHVGEDVQEPHDGVPQPAVGQGLLVARARALPRKRCVTAGEWAESESELLPALYLDVLGQGVKYLLRHRHGLGEVLLPRFIDDVLAGVIPVEIAD